ncbi:hypothetical protein Tco_0318159 [Tanacetum coccineum]
MPPKRTTTPMTDATIKQLIAQGVVDAMADYEANSSSRNGDWFKKMESVFDISNCTVACQIKFSTCTLLGVSISVWNPEESDQVEKYVGGLPDMIQGSVMASKPKTMQEAIEFANELID